MRTKEDRIKALRASATVHLQKIETLAAVQKHRAEARAKAAEADKLEAQY